MYSERDLFVIDEFFSMKYVSDGFRHLVSPKALIDVVSSLRRTSADANADPVEVMTLISKLRDVLGTFLFGHVISEDVWEEWCEPNEAGDSVTGDEDPFSDPNLMLWAGNKGQVFLRRSGDDFVFHVVPTGGGR